MKFKLIHLLAFVAILFFISVLMLVKRGPDTKPTTVSESHSDMFTFQTEYKTPNGISWINIVTDKETSQEYIVVTNGGSIAITPRLKKNER